MRSAPNSGETRRRGLTLKKGIAIGCGGVLAVMILIGLFTAAVFWFQVLVDECSAGGLREACERDILMFWAGWGISMLAISVIAVGLTRRTNRPELILPLAVAVALLVTFVAGNLSPLNDLASVAR